MDPARLPLSACRDRRGSIPLSMENAVARLWNHGMKFEDAEVWYLFSPAVIFGLVRESTSSFDLLGIALGK